MSNAPVSTRAFRRWARGITLGYFLLVGVIAFAFWLVAQQQAEGERQRDAIRVGACTSTITGRATQLMFADVLVAAAQANGATAREERRIDAFEAGVGERLLGELPATCREIMGLEEFRRRVELEARPPPAAGGVSFG